MKSLFHQSAVLFAASMPLLPGGVSADIAPAIDSQSRPEASLPGNGVEGSGATITPVSVQQTVNLRNPTLSTFHVTFAPGGSVVLHGAPSRGYVVVHVLSGALTAWAWEAQVGIYHSGETWAEPAFAYDIATRNASAHEPAEPLVVLMTESAK